MSVPLEVLQARAKKHGVVTVTFNYCSGGRWGCELRTVGGREVKVEPGRHWGELISNGLAELQKLDDCEHKRMHEQPGDETFYPRKGCLDCNQWLEPVKLRKP